MFRYTVSPCPSVMGYSSESSQPSESDTSLESTPVDNLDLRMLPQPTLRTIFLAFYSGRQCQNFERPVFSTMSASSQLLGLITYFLVQSVCVFSSPGPGLLNPRQLSCDSLVCPPSLGNFAGDSGELWNDVLDFGAGMAGWVIDKATGLLVPQPVESDSEKKQNNANAPVADPIEQPGPLDTPQDQCTATSNSNPNAGSGQVSFSGESCGLATLQLVWALNCKNAAENSALEATLKSMDNEVFAVKSPDCPDQNGVWFWVGKFTPEQIDSIKKAAHVVKTVESNIPVGSDFRTDSIEDSLDPTQFQKDLTAVPLVEEFPLQRRGRAGERAVSVAKGMNPSLNFLSTAPGKQPSNTYTSFKPTYNYMKIFLFEYGVIEYHPEIAGMIATVKEPRYMHPSRIPDSTPEENFQGTCMVSMIGSKRDGAAKGLHRSRNRRLTFVKINDQIWSLLAGIAEVYRTLQSDKYTTSGYNVVIMPVGISMKNVRKDSTPGVSLSRIQDMIIRMIGNWQVVFVVAVGSEGNTKTSGGTQVLETYPALWATRLPIIVVGAVDINTGENPPWSYDGPELTVRGPAQGFCLSKKPVGTSVASAYVGGLVAYFLSLPDVGAYLRGQGNVPRAMIEYLRRLSYSRSPSNMRALAVWNGLDSSNLMAKYSYWIGDPLQDIEIPRTAKPPATPPTP